MAPARIDTHHHIVTPRYRAWLEARGKTAGGKAIPAWSPVQALRFMDANQIAIAVLSVSTPGAFVGDKSEAREQARILNTETAEVVAGNRRRFGFFATAALPDVEASIHETTFALDHLSADGVVLLTNTDGVYLGDPSLDPLMAALNERRAVVFVHPGEPPMAPVPGIEAFVTDFLLDSVRAALNITKSGTLERYPDVRFILSHGGGFLPFAAARVGAAVSPDGKMDSGLQRLRKFYFDTALASSAYALPSLLAFADPERITFGSDVPYATETRSGWFTSELDRFELGSELRAAIAAKNALTLFPRLAALL